MPDSARWRGRTFRRWGRFPTERDWERSVVLEARPAPRLPAYVSDGAGLPFAPAALGAPVSLLDPDDPPVAALAAALRPRGAAGHGSSTLLLDWRVLARADGEVLFGRGRPPEMTTVAVRREGRRGEWRTVAITTAGRLRRTRDGIRASGWSLDPTHPPAPEDTVVRMLVTEQTRSGGALADTRLLAPDLHDGADEVVVTMFVAPRPGVIQIASPPPPTPARVRLPSAIGERALVDGSLWNPG